MYTPAHFAESRPEVLHDFIRRYPLGALISSSKESGLTASHIPMLLDSESGVLRCHMARANPQSAMLDSSPVLVIFTGPDHYISPSWYKTKEEHGKVVPTWNYTAVHVSGHARIFEGEALCPHLEKLTIANESAHGLAWRLEDAPRSYIDSLIKAIIGIEIHIEKIEGKWKMSQNRSAGDQQSVIEALEGLGTPASDEVSVIIRNRSRRQ